MVVSNVFTDHFECDSFNAQNSNPLTRVCYGSIFYNVSDWNFIEYGGFSSDIKKWVKGVSEEVSCLYEILVYIEKRV